MEPNWRHPHKANWYTFPLLFWGHLQPKDPKEGEDKEPLSGLKKRQTTFPREWWQQNCQRVYIIQSLPSEILIHQVSVEPRVLDFHQPPHPWNVKIWVDGSWALASTKPDWNPGLTTYHVVLGKAPNSVSLHFLTGITIPPHRLWRELNGIMFL